MKAAYLLATALSLSSFVTYAQQGKDRPTSGVYSLYTKLAGQCLSKIKVYANSEVDSLDVFGLHPGEILFQLSDINAGKKNFAVPDPDGVKPVIGMQKSIAIAGNGKFEYEITELNQYGYIAYNTKVAGSFNAGSIAFTVQSTNYANKKLHSPKSLSSCVYVKN